MSPAPVMPASDPPIPGPLVTPIATPIVQRVSGAAPIPPPPEAGRSERDLEELARVLFGRFRGLLKTELIHEREAKGLPFDDLR